jgi:hypothetical protein
MKSNLVRSSQFRVRSRATDRCITKNSTSFIFPKIILTLFLVLCFMQNVYADTQVIKIQRGIADIGNSGGTQTAPSDFTAFGSTTSAFVLNQDNRYMNSGLTAMGATNKPINSLSGGIALTATDTITFYRDSGSEAADYRFHWESWEYTGPAGGANEFIVRGRFYVQITAGNRTGTDTVTSATTRDKCIPFITGVLNSNTGYHADDATAIAWMSADDTVTVERGGSDSTTDVYGLVVEFTGSNWRVGHGRTADVTGDTGTIDLFAESVGTSGGTSWSVNNWSNALIFHQFKGDDSSTNYGIADTSATYYPNANLNQVDWYFDAGHDGTDNQHMVHVLENAGLTVTRFTDTGSLQGDNNIDISSAGITDLTNTVCVGSSESSGTGTTYSRGWKGIFLTSTTNVNAWASRSGNTISTRVQVADMPLDTEAAAEEPEASLKDCSLSDAVMR